MCFNPWFLFFISILIKFLHKQKFLGDYILCTSWINKYSLCKYVIDMDNNAERTIRKVSKCIIISLANEKNYSKVVSFKDLGKSLAKSLSSKIKSLHKAIYADTWLRGSLLPPYFSKRGISIPCGTCSFNISNENGFLLTNCEVVHFGFGLMLLFVVEGMQHFVKVDCW